MVTEEVERERRVLAGEEHRRTISLKVRWWRRRKTRVRRMRRGRIRVWWIKRLEWKESETSMINSPKDAVPPDEEEEEDEKPKKPNVDWLKVYIVI